MHLHTIGNAKQIRETVLFCAFLMLSSNFIGCVRTLSQFSITEPTTYAGTLSCIDCEAVEVHLNLFPDSTFFLSQRYEGAGERNDQIGTWNLNSSGDILVMQSIENDFHYFSLAENARLLALNHKAQPFQTNQPNHLSLKKQFEWIDVQTSMKGNFYKQGKEIVFEDAKTSLGFAVKDSEGSQKIENAFSHVEVERKAVSIRTIISNDITIDEIPRLSVRIIEILEMGVSLNAGKQKTKNSIGDGKWILEELSGLEIQVFSQKDVPFIQFTEEESNLQGYSGCNSFNGSVLIDDISIEVSAIASTRKACIPDNRLENNMFTMLEDAAYWQVTWPFLMFYDGSNVEIARFRSELPH